MKKFICFFLAISILLALSACRNPGTNGASDTPSTTEADFSGTASYQPNQEPMTAVSVPASTEYVTASNGTVIYSYTRQTMLLTLPDPDVANQVIIDFLNRVDTANSLADATLSAAKNAYNNSTDWVPYLYSILYSPTRIDQGVLSLFGNQITYNGGSHPERVCMAANYDLVTGDVLTLGSIMSSKASPNDFCQLVLEALADCKEEKFLYDGYEATVRQRFNRDESKDEDWYFTETGLCFYFAPYEIAGYASGVIIAEIPYSKLSGLLYDGYFPAERENSKGSISVDSKSSDSVAEFSQIAEIVLNSDGEMVFLSTDGLIWDVQLQVGTWDITGTEFTVSYTALFSHALSPGDAIMLQTQFGDALPHLRLIYRSGTETVMRYLFQSGKDGSVSLIDC